ncbi:unnamed protein product [Diamesa hyperborea]
MSLKREEILLLFDIDGTLTNPREEIDDDFEEFLYTHVKPRATIGLITGANIEKIYEQLKGKKFLDEFDYVFPENGIVHMEHGTVKGKSSFNEKLGEDTLQRFINFVLRYIADLELPYKRGTFIEFRNGMMNICPVGRQCSVEERKEFHHYDVKHQIRVKMIETLKKEFKGIDLMYSIGGQISFDVFPIGWDKSFCLSHIDTTKFKEIHFFGDQCMEGGNDYEIFNHPLTIGHKVDNYNETREILTNMFPL